jgi:hypothetical protein
MKCARCSGEGGAHFAFCFLAQAWERFMGPGYPWSAPAEPEPLDVTCVHGVSLLEPCGDCYPAGSWGDGEFERPESPVGLPGDPPDPGGVIEDFLVGSGHVASDAQWMPHAEAVTHLPEGYYDRLLPEPEPEPEPEQQPETDLAPRKGWAKGKPNPEVRARRAKERQAVEDAVVQFLYDETETVPGYAVRLDATVARFNEWAKASGRPGSAGQQFREIVEEVGLTVKTGRPTGWVGGNRSGRTPVCIYGIKLKGAAEPAEPKPDTPVVITKAPKSSAKHPLIGAKPGMELPKEWREMIEPLITEQGWEYRPSNGSGRGKPRLIAPDGKLITLANTPSRRALVNARGYLRQHGAQL